jgi:signal transduction histidine kinase
MVLLATVESFTYPSLTAVPDWSAWSVGLTVLAAGTVVGRTVTPVLASTACAGVFAGAALLHVQVVSGLWMIGTIGALLWRCTGSWPYRRRAGPAALLLVVCVITDVASTDRENLPVIVVVMAVAVTGGAVVATGRRRHAAAYGLAQIREREIRSAADVAVHAERTQVARDLHDVVSHAVGVIAMQAGAAEVSWPGDPEAVRRAIGTIQVTAEQTLAEMGDLLPGHCAGSRTIEDVRGLVDRMRAAGTLVDLTVLGRPDPRTTHVVYRVVQEALTNAVRHAPGASVHIEIASGPLGSTVLVRDDGPGPGVESSRGYGLVGLAERVGFAGGTLQTGPGPDGRGFSVSAALPNPVELVVS